jgi:hypothetical protein
LVVVEMFPAHAAKTAAAEKADATKKESKYGKVPGTEIQHMKGGIVVRVAIKSGMQFPPEDVEAAKKHVAEIKGENAGKEKGQASQKNGSGGSGNGTNWPKSWGPMPPWVKQWMAWYGPKGGGKGGGSEGKKKKAKKPKKELTPEQIEARQAKAKEREAKLLADEQRQIVNNDMHVGEVIARGNRCAWVKPENASRFPKAFQTKLAAMNAEMREKAKDAPKKKQAFDADVIYVRTCDVVTEDLKLKEGTMIKFKIYSDTKGVGGCQVVAK